MLEKQTALDRIEILKNQTVVARYITSIIENGLLLTEQVSANYIQPGVDYSNEDAKVQSICAVVHTPEVIAAFKAEIAPKAEA
jgi:hypothetical protein